MHWSLAPFRRFFDFAGRSRRKEYWIFVLVNFGLIVLLSAVDSIGAATGPDGLPETGALSVVAGIFMLIILIPSISAGVRRLHDTGRTGWWILISLVPLAGFIVLVIFYLGDSDPQPNKYGPSPKPAVGGDATPA